MLFAWKTIHEGVGIGSSHAQVTDTRPRSLSARRLKAPGDTSMSVDLHPTPDSSISLHEK